MEFIFILLLFLLFFETPSKKGSKSHRGSRSRGGKASFQKDCPSDDFDPADTFYLEDGLDHETDCDGYCEECDDYHDET